LAKSQRPTATTRRRPPKTMLILTDDEALARGLALVGFY
jgi:hypothetical protein